MKKKSKSKKCSKAQTAKVVGIGIKTQRSKTSSIINSSIKKRERELSKLSLGKRVLNSSIKWPQTTSGRKKNGARARTERGGQASKSPYGVPEFSFFTS